MHSQMIHPFLESAQTVLEQVANITSSPGEVTVKEAKFVDKHIWIKIGVSGHVTGDIVYGIEDQVALALISKMMGGFEVKEIDEMGISAISELGNMISGNASSILFNKGISLQITPPEVIKKATLAGFSPTTATSIPLKLDQIGEIQILVAVL